MTHRRQRPRAAALLAAGAYALHQLRYAVGYGGHAHDELAGQGHAYMMLLAPLLAVAIVVLMADFAIRLMSARARRAPGVAPRLRSVWVLATSCLLLAYAAQELAEGALAAGHPGGAASLTAGGGWVALPLAAAIGLSLALLVRGALGALELAAEPAPRVPRARPAAVVRLPRRQQPHLLRLVEVPSPARGPPLAAMA
ncbi:MAG: hypothetical protein ACJ760_15275 [Thermoleophilaceae bacterium]